MKQIINGQLVKRAPSAAFAALLGGVLLVLSACGTPGMTVSLQTVPIGNLAPASATALSANAVPAQPTQPPPTAVAAVPATDPTGAAPTQGAPAAAPSDDFVLIWVLYGTPTPNGAQPTRGPVTVPTTAPTSAPTTVTKVAQGPTAAPTLPPTTTRAGGAAPVAFKGDVNRGKSLFGGSAGCSACHDVTAGIVMVGPSLKGVASRAGARKPGFTPIDYLRESIMKPNAFVVPGFAAGVMVQNYGTTLTPAQIDDIVAYLLTLR